MTPPDRSVKELLENSSVYREWQAEREEILKYKWIMSEKAGRDIGYERALTDWIIKYRRKWRMSRTPSPYAPDPPNYQDPDPPNYQEPVGLEVQKIDRTIYSQLAINPRLLYQLPPRRFEELIADILKDMGYEVTLTPQTRDGGRDVLAVLNVPTGKMLTIVECKRYAANRKVGLDIVERFFYVIDRKDNASCGLIATTSFFSQDAQALARKFEYRLRLRDFDGLKEWIGQYGQWKERGTSALWTPTHPRARVRGD